MCPVTPPSAPPPPPGWHADPLDPRRQRLWDGYRWTEQTRSPSEAGSPETWAPPPAPVESRAGLRRVHLLRVVGIALIVVGLLVSWVPSAPGGSLWTWGHALGPARPFDPDAIAFNAVPFLTLVVLATAGVALLVWAEIDRRNPR